MKKLLITIVTAFFAVLAAARADTSYLLIQGAFGSTTTFEWQVNYQAGTVITGQDLLTAVFGSLTLDGTSTNEFGSYNYYASGNSTQGAGFIDFAIDPTTNPDPQPAQPISPFLVSVTLNSTTLTMDSSFSPGWTYYVAGGGGTFGSDNLGAPYTSGTWTFANDGALSRTLSDGSFDAYVFGPTNPFGPPAFTFVDGVNPSAADFSDATVINVIPEPGSAALFLLGGGAMLLVLLKKRRARI